MPRQVLVVDDEEGIRRVLRGYLEADGIGVREAATGAEALECAGRGEADLILLDVMLPDMDGVEVLRLLRTSSQIPVILVTARAEETDKLIGLAVGADDYVTKPFSPREVVARVKAVLRRDRGQGGDPDRLLFAGMAIDLPRRSVQMAGAAVELTTLEFDLLAALAAAPGRVFSRRQLLERVWGYDFYGDERVVDVHIRNLRKAMGDDAAAPHIIGTVRGVGYRFLPEPQ